MISDFPLLLASIKLSNEIIMWSSENVNNKLIIFNSNVVPFYIKS